MEDIINAADDEQDIQEEEVPYCDPQITVRESLKGSYWKQRTARFRKALVNKKSSMMKIKLWQNLMSKQDREEEEPVMHALSPIPPPAPRLSPDITSSTSYRYSSATKIPTTSHSQLNTSSSSSHGSDSDESDREIDKAHESDGSSEESSVKSMQENTLLLSTQGDPIDRLDASVVEDFLRSGKPIRAAALAALEAVHGKKFTDSEALQQLRKVYTLKPSVPKGRGRRIIAKRAARKPIRGSQGTNWCKSCESVMHRNCYYQIGDIVRLTQNGKSYFLQIQTLFKDWREGAYASMTWLTPKKGFKHKQLPFNPRYFDIRRDFPSVDAALDDVTHVMHMPTDYFDGHPSFWHPRPGMVYMRLGEPLVEFRPLEQPKSKDIKVDSSLQSENPSQPSEQQNHPSTDHSSAGPSTVTATDNIVEDVAVNDPLTSNGDEPSPSTATVTMEQMES